MRFTKGDIAIGVICIFITGALIGMAFKPKPKFAACVEVPKVQKMPHTKAEIQRFVRYYTSQEN